MKITVAVVVLALVCVVSFAEAARGVRRPVFPFSQAKVAPGAPLDSRVPNFKTFWYTQTLDHFSFANTQTFQQRYLVVGA
jgi:hypothetical protein